MGDCANGCGAPADVAGLCWSDYQYQRRNGCLRDPGDAEARRIARNQRRLEDELAAQVVRDALGRNRFRGDLTAPAR